MIYLNINDENNYDELTGEMFFEDMKKALESIDNYLNAYQPKKIYNKYKYHLYLPETIANPNFFIKSLNREMDNCAIILVDIEKLYEDALKLRRKCIDELNWKQKTKQKTNKEI
jgi:hypothetical protein